MTNPMLLIDGYKADHRRQYPEGTEYVCSNFTPRQTRVQGINHVVFFGLQYFIKEYLIRQWNEGFFNRPKEEVVNEYKRVMNNYLGPDAVPCEHIGELHDLGYLPIKVKALPEGTLVPIGVPVLTIINTEKKFFWLTNYLETLISNILWKPTTSATTAFQYRKRFETHAEKTGYDKGFIMWQAHDFSNRGMSGVEDAQMSAAGHAISFNGSDTISVISFLENFYDANSDSELIVGSVPATEHSVMCMGEKENEIDTFRRLITKLYPKGIVSIVSDTWDFWKVIGEYLPLLKEEINSRPGRVVIRPDSGNPVDIICGLSAIPGTLSVEKDGRYFHGSTMDDAKEVSEGEYKGAYQMLWEIFGGHINDKGYRILNEHIGLIYGDAITIERQNAILNRLEHKGFAASNLVLGVGSFTFEYVTRDTFGFAMKATWGQVNGVARDIFKDPVTSPGFKKSAKGLLMVYEEGGVLKLKDQCTPEQEACGLLRTVFSNGILLNETTLSEIRERITSNLKN